MGLYGPIWAYMAMGLRPFLKDPWMEHGPKAGNRGFQALSATMGVLWAFWACFGHSGPVLGLFWACFIEVSLVIMDETIRVHG